MEAVVLCRWKGGKGYNKIIWIILKLTTVSSTTLYSVRGSTSRDTQSRSSITT